MANIERTKVELINEVAEVVSTAGATAGKWFDFAGKDDRTCILLANSNSSAATVTFVAGNGLAGVADMEVSVPASKTAAIRIDSAAFKAVAGENKGGICIKSPTTVAVSVIELP